jgi:protein O-GlcNAc transferase
MSSAEKIFQDAFGAFNLQKYEDADRLFRKFLKSHPSHVGALNLLTIVLIRMKRFAEAEPLIARAVKLDQSSDVAFYNYGIILKTLNKPQQSVEQFTSALRLNAKASETWNNRGTAYNDLQEYQKALADFDQAISLNPNYADAIANRGKSLVGLRRYDEAFATYDKALTLKPDLAEAWLGRGQAFAELDHYEEAFAAYEKALLLRPDLAEAWLGCGKALGGLTRYNDALIAYERALSLRPDLAEAWFGRANVLFDLRRYDEALAAYDKTLSFEPDRAEARLGRGNALAGLKRHNEALAESDRTLSLRPDLTEAWLSRGNILVELRRSAEAVTAYDKALSLKPALTEAWLGRGNAFAALKRDVDAFAAYDGALSLKPDLAEAWLGRGNVLSDLKRNDEAVAEYDKALSLNPDIAETWLGRGNVLFDLKRREEAVAAFDKVLSLNPDMAEAWLGLGNVFFEANRHDDALAAFDRTLSLKPDLAEAWSGRGNVFVGLKRYDEASTAYDKALVLQPDLAALEGECLHCRMHLCDWSNFETERDHLVRSVRNGKENTNPFAFLGVGSSAEDQFECAQLWTRKRYPPSASAVWRGEVYRHDRIRVGYVSSDFRQHPVADLIAGVFECHDRSQFDVLGISIGADDHSEIRRRVVRSFDKFIDATTLSVDEAAKRVKAEEIDILIDLNGATREARTEIFARRPAPVQVNYLGYPGTMGARYFDYIVADPVLVPESQQGSYMEKVVYLPHSYLPHDDTSRPVSDRSFERSEFGLPADGFVFCCFNNAYKLNPHLFRSRMKLLKAVEGSVLWLSEQNATAVKNLRNEAAAAGVDPDRLVFAKRLPSSADHLARHRLADLFLDTLPYNAHTTASDALWAGLPVLTQIGETFAGRVAASLLNAVGLPELIAATAEQFESMAVELATTPERLSAIKHKLAQNRATKPLFNTKLYTKHLEGAYAAMYSRCQNGLLPDHIHVAQ